MADGAILRFSPGKGEPVRQLDGGLEDVDAQRARLLTVADNPPSKVMRVDGGWLYKPDGRVYPTLDALKDALLKPVEVGG